MVSVPQLIVTGMLFCMGIYPIYPNFIQITIILNFTLCISVIWGPQ